MSYQTTQLKPFGVCLTAENTNTHVNEINIADLQALFAQHQLVLLRGFTTFSSKDQFADYCESWGEVSLWPFGKVLELIKHDEPADHIFDNSYVPLHWDGMYRPQVPEYQLFHCLKAPLANQGGRTVFSNTALVLQNTDSELKAYWEKITGHYEREMAFYNSKTISPLITQHPYKNQVVIRYNEPHFEENGHLVNQPNLQFSGVVTHDEHVFHQTLLKILYAPEYCYKHTWQTGDVVIADNFTLLHGREAFIATSPRHLQRVQVLSDPPLNNPSLVTYQ